MPNHVIIVGAGASGLMAAYSAAKSNAKVTILEKNQVPGKKILASGAGRCNLTNKKLSAQNYHLKNPAFIEKVFKVLPPSRIPEIFEEMGLVLKQEPDGRIFPRCGKSREVLDVLLNSLEDSGVEIRTLTKVIEIKKEKLVCQSSGEGKDIFILKTASVKPSWHKGAFKPEYKEFLGNKVILACGGISYLRREESLDGYRLAKSLGHTVSPLHCSLVPLRVKESFVRNLDGVRINAGLSVYVNGKEISNSSGEILFTEYGISGPAALDLSRDVSYCIGKGKIFCLVNFFPEYESQKLKTFLKNRWQMMKDKKWKNFLDGLFEEKLSGVITDILKINPSKKVSEIPSGLKEKFLKLMREFKLEITGTLDFKDAMVTAGGVDINEINPETFESRIVKGLYLIGELLDIDGNSGGYNLHFAWTSGYIAGRNAGFKSF